MINLQVSMYESVGKINNLRRKLTLHQTCYAKFNAIHNFLILQLYAATASGDSTIIINLHSYTNIDQQANADQRRVGKSKAKKQGKRKGAKYLKSMKSYARPWECECE